MNWELANWKLPKGYQEESLGWQSVNITFSTDMDYWNERMKKANGEWMSRGDLTINFLLT